GHAVGSGAVTRTAGVKVPSLAEAQHGSAGRGRCRSHALTQHDGRAMDGQGTRRTGGSSWGRSGEAMGAADLGRALDGARSGDEFAFRSIYRALQPGILRYVRGLVGEDAEDVASEAWAQVARDSGDFPGDADGFRRCSSD